MLRLQLFDSPQIESTAPALPQFRSRKAEALLYYLAITPGSHQRLRLANLLWSELPEETALGNLRYALWNIRQVLHNLPLHTDRATISLQLNDAAIWVDANEFQRLLHTTTQSPPSKPLKAATKRSATPRTAVSPSAAPLAIPELITITQRAVDLYRGDFLAGFELSDAVEFEEWLQKQRTNFQQQALDAFSRLSDYYTAQHQLAEAVTVTRRLLSMAPWEESAHRQLMLLLATMGRRDAALAHYQQCREILAAELGVEPEPATHALMEQIRSAQLGPVVGEALTLIPHGRKAATEIGKTETSKSAEPTTPAKPFLGRAREYSWLQQQWAQAIEGQSGLALIRGEAGVGKTRLVEEVSRHILIRGGLFLRGRCYEFSGPLPYQPIATALRPHLAQLEAQSPAANVVWLAELAQLLPEVRQQTMLTLPAQHGADRYRLFEAITQCLQVLTAKQPLLLFIDDLQWADADTLDLMGYLVRRLSSAPFLLVGAYRPGEVVNDHALVALRRPLYNEGLDQELSLRQLSAETVQQIVQVTAPVTAGDSQQERLIRFLYEISQGNPFILFETLHEMEERGWLQADAQRGCTLQLPESCLVGAELAAQTNLHLLCGKAAPCHAKAANPGVKRLLTYEEAPSKGPAVPLLQGNLMLGEVKNRIRRRIARLAAESQQLLALAVVIGHPFEAKLLQVASGLPAATVVDHVEDWLERNLVRTVQQPAQQQEQQTGGNLQQLGLPRFGQYRYDFSHDLIRSVVYHDLSPLRRQSIHLQLGAALEQLYAGQLEKIVEWLAHHFHCGYEPQKALHYLQRAAQQAQAVYALPLALEHYQQALFYWEQLYHPSDPHVPTAAWRQRWDLLLGQAEVSRMLGQLKNQNPAVALETVAQEVTHWGDDRDRLRVLEQQIARLEHTAELDQRRQFAKEGLRLARLLADTLAEGNFLQAWADCDRDMANHSEALVNYSAALQKFSQAQQPRQMAFCLIGMGQIHLFNHRFGQALGHFEQAVQHARTGGYQDALIGALNAIARMYLFLGNVEGALATTRTVLTLCDQLGFDSGASVGLVTHGYVHLVTGNLPQARAHFEQAMTITLTMDESLRMADVQCCLGHLCLQEQEYKRALGHFKQAEALCGNFYYGSAIEARSYRAIAHLALGEWKEALVCSHHAVVWLIGREHAMVAPQRIHWNQYQVLLAQREAEEAQEALVKAHRIVVNQFESLAGAYPTTVDSHHLREQFLTRLPWNQDIMTMWDMLPITNSNVALHFLHGYPG